MTDRFENLKLAKNPTSGSILYIGDPMCSWCWGIAEHLTLLREKYSGIYDFEIIMGGLRPDGGEPWNTQMKDFLRHHWEQVHERSGQYFNFSLLDLNAFDYDTEPPSRAVVAVRDLFPEKVFDFFKSVQYAFYVKNENPADEAFYTTICEDLDIPYSQFITLFESDHYKGKVRIDFKKSKDLGVHGFPTVLFKKDESVDVINYGYADFETMEINLKRITEKV